MMAIPTPDPPSRPFPPPGQGDPNRGNYRMNDETPARAIDHLDRAKKRMAELRPLQSEATGEAYRDKFTVLAPEGWAYNWKTFSIYNKEDPSYMSRLYRNGWQPVQASRHRELLYPEYDGDNIVVDENILMERPMEFHKQREREHIAAAREQIERKEASMADAPPGTAPRDHPQVRPKVKSEVGPAVIE